ncbi:unnamed protein product [Allacma fusca]|uniref:Uncharacterized protein n=1 Tax=Allacma fusca TaxID=39272 RepID=A0A8J2LV26_9HEXA|nr:unnamed protein product [Allacma fusca]
MGAIITEKEQEVLQKFRERIRDLEDEMTEDQKRDVDLLRWLRARDLNLGKAEEMLRKHIQWRKDNDIKSIMSWRPPPIFPKELPFQISGRDKDGCYIFVCPGGKWDIRKLCENGYLPDLEKGNQQYFEIVSDFIRHSSVLAGKPITQFVTVHDMEGYSIKQMLSSQAREANIKVMRVMEANYPEVLRKAYVVNAPKVFAMLFNLIKPIMSAQTLSKIEIFDSNQDHWRKVLRQYIDPDELPSHYGGTNTTCPIYHIDRGLDIGPRAPNYDEELFKTVTVPASSDYEVPLKVTSVGTVLSWNFKSDSYDIGFKFLEDETVLFSCSRCDSHINTQKGIFACEKAGDYVLLFDNTYSKLRGKTVHFYVHAEE